jgi:hypothetical protein
MGNLPPPLDRENFTFLCNILQYDPSETEKKAFRPRCPPLCAFFENTVLGEKKAVFGKFKCFSRLFLRFFASSASSEPAKSAALILASLRACLCRRTVAQK